MTRSEDDIVITRFPNFDGAKVEAEITVIFRTVKSELVEGGYLEAFP